MGSVLPIKDVRHKRIFPNDRSALPYYVVMLDVNRLRIFRSVVASGSVNESARLLGYTPSTVSQHLHTLEREVGFALVERVGRGIRATSAGADLALASGEVLDAMAKLEARTRDLRQGTTSKLTISTFASAAYAWMPTVARTLRQEFPRLTVELSILEAEGVESQGKADVEIHTELPHEPPQVPATHTRFQLGLDDYLVALPPDHRLAEAGTADLGSFADQDWVHYDFRDETATRLVAHACAGAGFAPRYVVRAQDHVSGLAFVSAGVGIALVPTLMASRSAFDLAYVVPRNPRPQRRIVALVRNRVRSNPAAERTITLLAGLGRGLASLEPTRPGSGPGAGGKPA